MCLCMCFSSLKRLNCVVVFRAEGLQEAYSCCHVDGACKYHHTVSRPSTSGQRSVFANVILMLKTSWHDPDKAARNTDACVCSCRGQPRDDNGRA